MHVVNKSCATVKIGSQVLPDCQSLTVHDSFVDFDELSKVCNFEPVGSDGILYLTAKNPSEPDDTEVEPEAKSDDAHSDNEEGDDSNDKVYIYPSRLTNPNGSLSKRKPHLKVIERLNNIGTFMTLSEFTEQYPDLDAEKYKYKEGE